MKIISLREVEETIQVFPKTSSFYISFGVSLLRVLIYLKKYTYISCSS